MKQKLKEAGVGIAFGVPAIAFAATVRTQVPGFEGMMLAMALFCAFLAGGYLTLSRMKK